MLPPQELHPTLSIQASGCSPSVLANPSLVILPLHLPSNTTVSVSKTTCYGAFDAFKKSVV